MKEKAKQWLAAFGANPVMVLTLLAMWGVALANNNNNPLADALMNVRNILCGTVTLLTGPFGGALAVFMLALGFAGLLIGNRNAMGLIITAIAGGALLIAARSLGPALVGQGC